MLPGTFGMFLTGTDGRNEDALHTLIHERFI